MIDDTSAGKYIDRWQLAILTMERKQVARTQRGQRYVRDVIKMVSGMLIPFNTSGASNPRRRLKVLQFLQTNVVIRRVYQWLAQLACANLGVPVLLYPTHRLTFESRKLRSSERWKISTRRRQGSFQPGNSLAHPTCSSLELW